MTQVVGILGGMGPRATVEFYERLLTATPANRDQDHIPLSIWANPTVPDRTAAYENRGESVVPALTEGVHQLQTAGASFIVCPCNTAHIWLPDITKDYGVPLLSILDTSVSRIRENRNRGDSVGILATNATLGSHIFQTALNNDGIRSVLPDRIAQDSLVQAIYRVKSGSPEDLQQAADLVSTACHSLVSNGAQAVLAACTEVSVIMNRVRTSVPVIDSIESLATGTVERWYAR